MRYLKETKGCDCIGIEVNPGAAAKARASGFSVLESDVSQGLQAAHGLHPFDYVVFGDVLEHLPDPHLPLEDARQVLSDHGHVIVSLPNIVYFVARLRLVWGVWRYENMGIFDRTHLRFFSVATGKEFVEGCGYRIEEAVFVGLFSLYGGQRWCRVIRSRPGLLASQMVFAARVADAPGGSRGVPGSYT
jgi:SAM-dependent methyltransferase